MSKSISFNNEFLLNTKIDKSIDSIKIFCDIFNYFNNNQDKRVKINLNDFDYIHPAFAVLIPAFYYVARETNNKAIITYNPQNSQCLDFLNNTGILQHFFGNNTEENEKEVKFRKIENEEHGINLAERFINKSPILLKSNLKSELISKTYEIIANAFTHSNTSNIFCCGNFDNEGSFIFSVYDTGDGIPYKIRHYLKKEIKSSECLRWAWESGNSTLNGTVDYSRGIGLNTLEQFIKLNKGEIFMVSSNSYCTINQEGREFKEFSNSLLGTLVTISIRKDDLHIYGLKGEN